MNGMEARGAVKCRPLTNERGGQVRVRRGAYATSRYRPAGGGVRLPLWTALRPPVIKRPQAIDTPSGL